ncbi:MAG TPA: flagellar export chaperone FliS [Armatimonadetes bacterium]|jgi:flagellar protein FliS|nr:flagellar export chaperone FliS [Armatimonadota bacterium]
MQNPYLLYQEQRIQHASPGERVLMLYDGALRFLRGASLAMETGNAAGQSHNLDRAQSILLGLISSLNIQEGGELAICLLRVYEYCYNRLCDASANDDVTAITEVAALLNNLRGAWADAAAQVERGQEAETSPLAMTA